MKSLFKSFFVFIYLFLVLSDAYPGSVNILPTKEKPLLIDEKNKKVLIYTELNVMHLFQQTVHWGVVFKDGKFGDRAILKAYCNQLDFHDALVKIGAKPGNNLNKDSVGKYVDGDELILTAIVDNKEYPVEKIFNDTTGKGFKIKFGGNRKASEEQKTGCITCLESCWISITSNANYPMTNSIQRFMFPNSKFKGNEEVLPAKDGYPVILVYKLK